MEPREYITRLRLDNGADIIGSVRLPDLHWEVGILAAPDRDGVRTPVVYEQAEGFQSDDPLTIHREMMAVMRGAWEWVDAMAGEASGKVRILDITQYTRKPFTHHPETAGGRQ